MRAGRKRWTGNNLPIRGDGLQHAAYSTLYCHLQGEWVRRIIGANHAHIDIFQQIVGVTINGLNCCIRIQRDAD